MKYLELNGKSLEIVKSSTKQGQSIINTVLRSRGLVIDEAYKRPSNTKIDIYNSWWKWYTELENLTDCETSVDFGRFGVCSYNSNFFTLSGLVHRGEKDIYLYITSSHDKVVIE